MSEIIAQRYSTSKKLNLETLNSLRRKLGIDLIDAGGNPTIEKFYYHRNRDPEERGAYRISRAPSEAGLKYEGLKNYTISD